MSTLHPRDEERLLSGQIDPDDAAPDYRVLASIIGRARSADATGDSSSERELVTAMARAIEIAAAEAGSQEKTSIRRLTRTVALPSGRVLAATTALLFGGGVVAAAATGSLPTGVQQSLAGGVAHFGISIPDPTTPPTSPPTAPRAQVATPRGGSTTNTQISVHALCARYAMQHTSLGTSAFSRLQSNARARHKSIEDFCAPLLHHRSTTSAVPAHSSTPPPAVTTTLPSPIHVSHGKTNTVGTLHQSTPPQAPTSKPKSTGSSTHTHPTQGSNHTRSTNGTSKRRAATSARTSRTHVSTSSTTPPTSQKAMPSPTPADRGKGGSAVNTHQ